MTFCASVFPGEEGEGILPYLTESRKETGGGRDGYKDVKFVTPMQETGGEGEAGNRAWSVLHSACFAQKRQQDGTLVHNSMTSEDNGRLSMGFGSDPYGISSQKNKSVTHQCSSTLSSILLGLFEKVPVAELSLPSA